MRKIHNLIQGTPEWHAYRANHFNASDAPAMLGESQYKTRDQLLREIATGVSQEVDAGTQRLFDQGHEFEAMARPIAEKITGEDLFPATVSLEISGLSLSASLDGWTMDEAIIFEHKTMNKSLEAFFASSDPIPLQYRIQMEQQLMVSGAEKCLFMASKGTDESQQHVWYFSDPELRNRIIEGWKQFAIDIANYVAPEVTQIPTAETVVSLPGITYNTTFNGKSIELKSNLDAYKAAAEKLVEQSKKKLETDQDFANAEARIKACKSAEEKIAVIQESAVAEVGDIDKFVKDLGAIAEMLRQCRLNEDKQVKARKLQIKGELVEGGNKAIAEFKSEINARYKSVRLPEISGDFAGVISGLKSFDSMQSKINDEVARCKIEIKRIASVMDENLHKMELLAKDKQFLFADLQQIVTKEPEHFELIVNGRLKDHEANEQERIQAEAKRIADEQIEKDRLNNIAEGLKAAHQEQHKEQMKGVIENIGSAVTPIASTERTFLSDFENVFQPTKVTQEKTDYQIGMLDGLDLALAIFMKHGANGFAKAIEDFIESDCIPEKKEAA